jgi:glycosyltransferase involved in cell wall biosynthesis|tara:strand:+ start:512 stop:1363 length:852 start_codon:yes stop_codon:yes gene_type:complete
VPSERLRLIYVGRDIELRIISLLVRAQEVAEEVILIDMGSTDRTVDLANEFGCQVLNYNDDELTAPKLAKVIASSSIDQDYSNLIISVTNDWKLRELPVVVNRSRESWDIYLAFNNSVGNQELITEELVIESLDIDHIFLSTNGLNELAKANSMTSMLNFPKDLRVRVIESVEKINMPQRESLATASRFAQMFYWMLETKHPLFLFGIPGVVLFILGFRLSGNVVDTFNELNSVSIGVTLTTIAMTLVGLFAMMVALILYIMGKQVEQIQSQYGLTNYDDKIV